jgi:hypothetical protein
MHSYMYVKGTHDINKTMVKQYSGEELNEWPNWEQHHSLLRQLHHSYIIGDESFDLRAYWEGHQIAPGLPGIEVEVN